MATRGALGRLQGVLHALIPREEEFFQLFERMSANTVAGVEVLHDLMHDFRDLPEKVAAIVEIEHEGDNLTHEVVRRLNSTFMTPVLLDRQDILDLANRLDDVLDLTEAVIDRMHLYKIQSIREPAKELADILLECVRNLHDTIARLPRLTPTDNSYAEIINRLENEGDRVLKNGLAALFEENGNAVEIIKWKELFDYIEEAIDRCEDTVNVIEGAIVKNS